MYGYLIYMYSSILDYKNLSLYPLLSSSYMDYEGGILITWERWYLIRHMSEFPFSLIFKNQIIHNGLVTKF